MRLGDVCTIRYGKDHKPLANGSIPVYGSGGLMRYVDKKLSDGPSVLIPRKGTLRNIFYVDGPFWTVDTLFWTQIDESRVVPSFLYYQLKGMDLASLNVGTAVPSLTTDVLNKVQIDLPPLEKQRKVVELLESLDSKIKTNMHTNGYLEELLDALFNRFRKEADDSWEIASLLDIADYKNGLAMQKFRPQPGDKGLPVLKMRELGQGGCGPDAERCSSDIDESVRVHDGDLVFSWSGTLLLDFWAGEDAGLNQHLFKVTSADYPSWFYYMWTKHHMNRFIAMAKDRATTMGHIKRSALANAQVEIPPETVLQAQTEVLQPIVDAIVGLRVQSKRLVEIRDALLPKLMAGEIDVSKVELSTPPNSHFIQSTYLLMADTGFGKHNSSGDGGQMPRGIIYVMTTVVPGLVKIGKSGTGNFEQRMYQLERNGYFNVTGLRRLFAIEVEDYDEKELMLDEIFSRSRVPNSELFALDPELAVQLLSSFEGRQVYPELESKEQSFDQATRERRANPSGGPIPDGTYSMSRRLKREGLTVSAAMTVAGGRFVVPRGTRVARVDGTGLSSGVAQLRRAFVGPDGVTTDDVEFSSPSSAGSFVIGASCDGWVSWRDADGRTIDHFRGTED